MENKESLYSEVYAQAQSLLADEKDCVANAANLVALIHRTFHFWWTGFYRVVDNELVLGPYQGPLACTRIGWGKGVCGTAWADGQTVIVPDVEHFAGHIACSSESRSEIVVPCRADGKIVAVLDIDSELLGTFDETDARWLEKIVALMDPASQAQPQEEELHCPDCGGVYEPHDVFCPVCGNKIDKTRA